MSFLIRQEILKLQEKVAGPKFSILERFDMASNLRWQRLMTLKIERLPDTRGSRIRLRQL